MSDHATYKDLGYDHICKQGLEDGQCLARHGGYKRQRSCAHQHQSAHRAKADEKMYGGNLPVGAFLTGQDPWPNNAHHLVPVAQIRGAITNAVSKKSELVDHVIGKLITAPYNVNFWKNMISLPCQLTQASTLGLPIHSGGHYHYNIRVRDRLDKIFKEACEAIAKGNEDKDKDHKDKEDPKDIAAAVERLQQDLYDAITSSATKTLMDQRLEVARTTEEKRKAFHINKLAEFLV